MMKMIQRDLENEVLAMAAGYPVVTLLGPRQSGKSTLVKKLFAHRHYVTLEDLDERNLAENDPRAFLERFPDGAILDEIQRQPNLLSYIQGIVDEKEINGMFILTGSHQLALHESIAQSLAGRTAILKLLPFSIMELSQSDLQFSMNDYLLHGMYPRIYKSNLNPTKFYRDYVQTYVERDVRKMINIKDLSVFQHFMKLCAGRIGQIFNASNLGNELGLSQHTINSWLSILEASFLVFRLQPYFENFGKRIIKSSKLYFTDVGLATYLLDIYTTEQLTRDPLRGNLVENFVISDLIKSQLNNGYEPNCYFYRDSNQNEVDVILKSGNNLIPIEIKSSKTFNYNFLKGLNFFQSLVSERCPYGFLIYDGEQEQKVQSFYLLNYKNTSVISEMIDQI